LRIYDREPHVYLLPEYEDPASQQEVLEEFWLNLFEAMLEGWVRDEAFWPKDRTLGMFQEWFEIQMCSIVQDLGLERSRLSFRTGRAKSIVFRQNGILAKDKSKGSRSSLIRAKKHLPG